MVTTKKWKVLIHSSGLTDVNGIWGILSSPVILYMTKILRDFGLPSFSHEQPSCSMDYEQPYQLIQDQVLHSRSNKNSSAMEFFDIWFSGVQGSFQHEEDEPCNSGQANTSLDSDILQKLPTSLSKTTSRKLWVLIYFGFQNCLIIWLCMWLVASKEDTSLCAGSSWSCHHNLSWLTIKWITLMSGLTLAMGKKIISVQLICGLKNHAVVQVNRGVSSILFHVMIILLQICFNLWGKFWGTLITGLMFHYFA